MKKVVFVLLTMVGCVAQNSGPEDVGTSSLEVQESRPIDMQAREPVGIPGELRLDARPLACGDFDCNTDNDCKDNGGDCGLTCFHNAFFGICGTINP